jgi:hypothetical protein
MWKSQQEVAETLSVPLSSVQQALQRAREHWGKQAWMTALRQDVAAILDKNGGLMTAEELASAVLAARGSAADEPYRSRLATAVAYTAVEIEMARESARYTLWRTPQCPFVVATAHLAQYYVASPSARAQYAESLGAKADAMAQADPLLTPARVIEELQGVIRPEGDPVLPPDRLLRLAAAVSQVAALSSRLELYPRGMAAARALKLGAGSLVGPRLLTVPEMRQRIASRYPQAEPLPGRPQLDDLLQEAGLEWIWDDSAAEGQGAYRPRPITADPSHTSSTLSRLSTAEQPGILLTPEAEAAQALEDRLARAIRERRFLLLTVAPRYLLRAEEEIMRRFAVARMSLEGLLIQAMQTAAAALGARWEVVVKADASTPDSADWRRLLALVRRAMPTVEQTLRGAERPVLLVYPGLLARYDQIQLLERLREACAQTGGGPGFIVLIPADAQHHLPVLDGKPVPVILASEWARIPEAWLENIHRS